MTAAGVVDALVIALIVVPVFPMMAMIFLLRHWQHFGESPSLAERALIAFRDWLVASSVAVLALNRTLDWNLSPEATALVLTVALLLVALPSLYWLWLYRRGAFRR